MSMTLFPRFWDSEVANPFPMDALPLESREIHLQ